MWVLEIGEVEYVCRTFREGAWHFSLSLFPDRTHSICSVLWFYNTDTPFVDKNKPFITLLKADTHLLPYVLVSDFLLRFCLRVRFLSHRNCMMLAGLLCQHMDFLFIHLTEFNLNIFLPQKSVMKTTWGILDPPVGNTRLNVIRLISSLLQTNTSSINGDLMELNSIAVILVRFCLMKSPLIMPKSYKLT